MHHIQHGTPKQTLFQNKTLVMCLGLIALAIVSVVVFNVSVSTVVFLGFALACPLMHLWMMKDGHKH